MTSLPKLTNATLLVGQLRADGWRELRHAIPNAPCYVIDPDYRVRVEVHEPHRYPYTLLRHVASAAVLAEFGPPTPHPVIAAAARAACRTEPGGGDAARTVTELGFTPAPVPAQRLLPALAHTHPDYTATAYLYPEEGPGQGGSWSVYGADDAWVAALDAGASGALLAAILTATERESGCER